MAKTEFNLKTTPQDMMKQLVEWAESLTPEEKAQVREELATVTAARAFRDVRAHSRAIITADASYLPACRMVGECAFPRDEICWGKHFNKLTAVQTPHGYDSSHYTVTPIT